MNYIICALIGYIIGSFNLAYVISKIKGFDIRDKGSNNPGASNATIVMGKKIGVIVALTDILKSFLAMVIVKYLFSNVILCFLAGAFAVVGHLYPFYLGFKGGKGFASYLGIMLFYNYKLFLLFIVLSFLITLITDYIAIATLTYAITFPICFMVLEKNLVIFSFLSVVSFLMILKHLENIRRIINKEEIGFKKGVFKKINKEF